MVCILQSIQGVINIFSMICHLWILKLLRHLSVVISTKLLIAFAMAVPSLIYYSVLLRRWYWGNLQLDNGAWLLFLFLFFFSIYNIQGKINQFETRALSNHSLLFFTTESYIRKLLIHLSRICVLSSAQTGNEKTRRRNMAFLDSQNQ